MTSAAADPYGRSEEREDSGKMPEPHSDSSLCPPPSSLSQRRLQRRTGVRALIPVLDDDRRSDRKSMLGGKFAGDGSRSVDDHSAFRDFERHSDVRCYDPIVNDVIDT